MKLKAIRQTTGEYGALKPGDTFQVDDPEQAKRLVDMGVAEHAGGSDRSTRKAKGAKETKGSQPMTSETTFSTTEAPKKAASASPARSTTGAARKRGGSRKRSR